MSSQAPNPNPPPPPHLLLQSEKALLTPIHASHLSLCPTMDLISVVSSDETVDIYRINGQKAFSIKRRSEDVVVDVVAWEFAGRKICVGWSDGSLEVVGVELGRRLRVEEGEGRRWRCVGWGLGFIDVGGVRGRLGRGKARVEKEGGGDGEGQITDAWDAFRDATTIEDFLARQPDLQALDVAPDLPDQLAMMDLETLFPRLPPIPLPPATPFMRFGQQPDAGAFGTQAEVDSLLHSGHLKEHNSVDMFIRCTDQGSVHPSMYDSAETVDIRLPASWDIESSTPLLHASHPYSCSHGLLTRIKRAGKTQLAFVPLTLGFIPSAGIYLHLIASKTSQLQSLLLYVQQTLQRIRTYFKHSRDLPRKLTLNISETLEEKNQGDLVQALFHLACTGHCPPLIKEWLTDELQEAGHKRWDNTVSTSLTTLLQLVHENLLPALDRCTVIISRLRGLALYHDSGWIFDTPISNFGALLEQLRNLRLLGHTILLYAGDEKRYFVAFSKWLRYEIDYEATEPDSQGRAEMDARDAGVNVALVLEYIRHGLVRSNLEPYLGEASAGGVAKPPSYEETMKAVELLKEGARYKPEALNLETVFGHLKKGCSTLFQRISKWQESETRMDSGIVLEEGDDVGSGVMDMRMVDEPSNAEHQHPKEDSQAHQHPTNTMSTYIAISPPSSPSTLHIHHLTHTPSISNLAKDLSTYSATTLHFPPGTRILAAKFADDTSLLILLQTPPQDAGSEKDKDQPISSLISLPYTTSSPSTSPITYHPLAPEKALTTLLPSGSPIPTSPTSSPSTSPPAPRTHITLPATTLTTHTKHIFDPRFTPLTFVVNGRKDRRLVVVLGEDRKHYRVLDMDFGEGVRRGRAADGGADADGGGHGGGDRGPRDGREGGEGSSTEEDEDVDMFGA